MRSADGSCDGLLDLLPGPDDGDRPWLVWYSPSERVELTGHVLGMWAAKCAGLLSAEAGPGPRVHVGLPAGWRALTWCLGAWLVGGGVMVGAARALPGAEVSVAQTRAKLCADADVQVLTPRASLAVRVEGELPPLVLDGAADVMTYADRFTPLSAVEGVVALLADDGTRLEREALAAAARAQAPTAARAVLVRAAPDALATAVLEVLSAWAGGATAVLVDSACDEALVALAARQEAVTARRPG